MSDYVRITILTSKKNRGMFSTVKLGFKSKYCTDITVSHLFIQFTKFAKV